MIFNFNRELVIDNACVYQGEVKENISKDISKFEGYLSSANEFFKSLPPKSEPRLREVYMLLENRLGILKELISNLIMHDEDVFFPAIKEIESFLEITKQVAENFKRLLDEYKVEQSLPSA